MTAFLSNSTAAAEVGTNILRGISDMISSIPQEKSSKTELTGLGTSHNTTSSEPKGPVRLSKSKIIPYS